MWLSWLSITSKIEFSTEGLVCLLKCFSQSRNISLLIQLEGFAVPVVPDGAPFSIGSLKNFRGNIRNGETVARSCQ